MNDIKTINLLYSNWKSGHLSDSEMAGSFFLFYHHKKFPSKKMANILESCPLDLNCLHTMRFKKVKGKAHLALKKWMSGEWNFKLIDYIPTPYEVLEFQAQGVRPVTMKIQQMLSPILNREDCLEFFLHDLEHGHMFFFNEELMQLQRDFFVKVQSSLRSNLWEAYLMDPLFKEKFYYLISDMNTHKEHYRQFLNAMLPSQDIPKFDFLFS